MEISVAIKDELRRFCESFVEDRIGRIQNNINNINESLKSETKSSAGDKHETGRAMIQLEREKLGHQLYEAEKMRRALVGITTLASPANIGQGSLVITSDGMYYISISAGAFKKGPTLIYCVSSLSPIGKNLLGKSRGHCFDFNQKKICIKKVL
ncbi:3-oxoacyl-ACP synthase [uncultured Eudoraea sp.]|uniref:3-oxoacyl-ACP synthase n=1 Tax=uncultured Eudoraea sp. TaxID=1035614 RepID=UPI0026196565|nr:3-oxoacyl-ACP synthase [uncultured Eudoraea sp.]